MVAHVDFTLFPVDERIDIEKIEHGACLPGSPRAFPFSSKHRKALSVFSRNSGRKTAALLELLFGGGFTSSSSPDTSRSRNFQLIALDKAKDGLPRLVFESDIGKTAGVSVRKSRADLTAWNVSCAGTR